MATHDTLYKRGDIIYSLEDGLTYKVLAVFKKTLWLRDLRTHKVIKSFPKKDAYK